MPIQISQEELWGLNILNTQINNVQAELKRSMAARDSFVKLLEVKYDAVFNLKTGALEPKTEKPKEK